MNTTSDETFLFLKRLSRKKPQKYFFPIPILIRLEKLSSLLAAHPAKYLGIPTYLELTHNLMVLPNCVNFRGVNSSPYQYLPISYTSFIRGVVLT